MARDRSTPLRAVVDDRARKRRSGERALAATLEEERMAARREEACGARLAEASTAVDAAVAALGALVQAGATAGEVVVASRYVARRRRERDDAASDLDAARAARALHVARIDTARTDLGRTRADEKVAERALERVVDEAQRVRERREDD
jgi:hypothetical protein